MKNIDSTGEKIVIIDDSNFNRTLIVSLLSEAGYEVLEVADAETGIALVKESCPDLILLDVTMPGMDGYEACEKLEGTEKTKDIPVIFLTGRTDQ